MILAALVILIFAGSAAAQRAKAPHPEPAPEQRKTLDQFSGAVQSHLPPPPTIPASRRNFIDDYIFGKLERDRVPRAYLCTDAEFLRRVSLDLTGRLPEPDAIRKFVDDTGPGKRE